jgi:hypothetical protein
MNSEGEEQKEENHERKGPLDYVTQIATLLIGIAGIIVGIYEFTAQQSSNDRDEFKRRMWERRLNACMEISGEIGNMINKAHASPFVPDSLVKAASEFQRIYWKNLPLLEDSSMDAEIHIFRDLITDKLTGNEDVGNPRILEMRAEKISDLIRSYIKNSWRDLDIKAKPDSSALW